MSQPHHSFGFTLAHDGERLVQMDRAERKRRYGHHMAGAGWVDDLPTRVWRMRIQNLMMNIDAALASRREE